MSGASSVWTLIARTGGGCPMVSVTSRRERCVDWSVGSENGLHPRRPGTTRTGELAWPQRCAIRTMRALVSEADNGYFLTHLFMHVVRNVVQVDFRFSELFASVARSRPAVKP